jgi:hypothetical protein
MTVLNLDFTDVESGGGILPAGTYQARVKSVEVKAGQKADYLNWCFQAEGGVAYLMTSLADNALWKLKGVLEALGAEIPQSKVKLDTDKFIGKAGTIHVVNEPYTGSDGVTRDSFKIQDVFPANGDTPAPAPVEEASDDSIGFDDDSIPF